MPDAEIIQFKRGEPRKCDSCGSGFGEDRDKPSPFCSERCRVKAGEVRAMLNAALFRSFRRGYAIGIEREPTPGEDEMLDEKFSDWVVL